ncbi:MAG: hypothetical protein GWN58_38650, partial [Anaerolineae bacterium]|nr:hypothetical protein [Anaerolineae bacterium]
VAQDPVPEVLVGHTGQVRDLLFTTVPGQLSLMSAGDDRSIRLWDLRDLENPVPGEIITGHQDDINAITTSPDGSRFVSASSDDTVRVWYWNQLDAGPWSRQGHDQEMEAVAFSNDGQLMATANADSKVLLWNVSDPDDPQVGPNFPHEGKPVAVAFHPEGGILATATTAGNGQILLWDLSNRSIIRQFSTGQGSRIAFLSFAAGGRYLA